MTLIKNPWDKLFFELVNSSKRSIKITSPFVKENIVSNLINLKNSEVKLTLVTSFRLMNYYTGASDLKALELIINENGIVKNFQKLHSKIYVFDDEKAVITSGNLTSGGLINNYEYGIFVEDISTVENVVEDYAQLINNDITGTITLSEINQAREILEKVPKTQPIILPEISIQQSNEQVEVFTGGISSILASLQGWKREVFLCLQEINKSIFTLQDVNSFAPYLQNIFPDNNNIEAKIRQQLQILRDIGLVEFLGGGTYKKLWQ
jgi:HKD family nuclease